jgi:hypothetical protein
MYTLVLGGGEEWGDSIYFADAAAAKRALILHSIGYHHDTDKPDVQPFLVEHRACKSHRGRLSEHDVLHVPLQQCKRAIRDIVQREKANVGEWVRLKKRKTVAEISISENAYKDYD